MTDLATALLDASDFVEARGVPLPFKRRDPQEPGRREKELAELKLQRAMMRLFRAQAEEIRKWLEKEYPARKQAPASIDELLVGVDEGDEEAINALWVAIFLILADAAMGGIALFASTSVIGLDYAALNSRAIEFLRTYTFDLFRPGIDATTQQAVREAVTAFIETPGMTIGDVARRLTDPAGAAFSKGRAAMAARTEITRAYAEGQMIAGRELQEQYPDLDIIKTWYTNNDSIVQECPICWPVHEAEAKLEEPFENGLMSPAESHPNCRCWLDIAPALET
jgi:hypothetical protein